MNLNQYVIFVTQYSYVYMMSNKPEGVIYTGITSDLIGRVYQHKTGVVAGFTKKYHAHRLVYYEQHEDIDEAIPREKRIKQWLRAWKIQLIEQKNPQWQDLYPSIARSME